MKNVITAIGIIIGLAGCATGGQIHNATKHEANSGTNGEVYDAMVGKTFPMPANMKCLHKADSYSNAEIRQTADDDCMYARADGNRKN